MKRLIVLAAALPSALLLGAVPAAADNGPHVSGAGVVADSCAGCHRTHTAQAGGLLKQPQGSLCYTCHGAGAPGSNTDVVNGAGYAPEGALRGGGFSYALIASDSPSGSKSSGVVPTRSSGQAVTSTHSVDASDQTAWGSGAISADVSVGKTIPLRCGNCHDPHGNGNYRILRDIPKESGAGEGVAIPDAGTKLYTTENYWKADDVNAPGFAQNVSAWCSTCHTRYLSSGPKADSGDAVFAYRHTSDKTSAGAGQRNCAQCHVSHGSNASMGARSAAVPFPDGSAGAGSSRLLRVDSRGVCQLCHGK